MRKRRLTTEGAKEKKEKVMLPYYHNQDRFYRKKSGMKINQKQIPVREERVRTS